MAPNSIRAIEDLLPVLYPGVKVSYGKVQQLLVEAEARARSFNAQADLSEIESAALDEMFSQGEAVLAGVDLDSGALFEPGGEGAKARDERVVVVSRIISPGISRFML